MTENSTTEPAPQCRRCRAELVAQPGDPGVLGAFGHDCLSWLAWLAERQLDPLTAGRVYVDMWVRHQTDAGAKPSTVRRRLSALSNWYRYLAGHDVLDHHPVAGVQRPYVESSSGSVCVSGRCAERSRSSCHSHTASVASHVSNSRGIVPYG